jgi:hypothetical protein
VPIKSVAGVAEIRMMKNEDGEPSWFEVALLLVEALLIVGISSISRLLRPKDKPKTR